MCVKKLICLASFVLVLGLVVDVEAATLQWTGAGADGLWSTPENWDLGALPTTGDRVQIQAVPGATIVNEGALAQDAWVGAAQSGELTVDGGTLTTTSHLIVARMAGDGTLNMKSGAVTVGGALFVGHTGLGTLNMTGGTFTIAGSINMAHKGEGHIKLHGGIINCGQLGMKLPDTGQVSTLDIGGGTLNVGAGNPVQLELIQQWLDAGLITAYEGNGTLNLEHDEAANQTTLTAVHNFNPSPADRGATIGAGAVELSWTLPDEVLKVDVWFSDDIDKIYDADPAALLVDQQKVTSAVVQAEEKTRYYWAVDTYLGGVDPNKNPKFGSIFSFYVDNLPPEVDAGANAVTWLVDGVMTKNLDATVTENGAYTVQWTVVSEPNDPNSPGAVIADPSAEDTTVTLSALGEYVFELAASDGEYTGTDTVTINVYNDGCEAAQSLPDYEPLVGDLNGDCRVDEIDQALMMENWLKDISLIEP